MMMHACVMDDIRRPGFCYFHFLEGWPGAAAVLLGEEYTSLLLPALKIKT